MLLSGSHNHCLDDLALLDVAARDGVFDRTDDDVADARIPATGSAEHPDAQDLLGTGVVGDLEPRLLLDHFGLLRFLDDFDEAPALGRAQRPGLHHAYPITDGGSVLLVVRLEPAGLAQHLAVKAVLHHGLDRDDNCLVHFVADYIAFTDLASLPALCVGRISSPTLCVGPLGYVLTHSSTPSASGSSMMPSSRSVSTV